MNVNIRKTAQLTGHNASVYALSAYNTDNLILSSGGDGMVVVWDLNNPELGRLLAKADGNIFSLTYLPEQHWVVAGNMYGGLHWIDMADQQNFKSVQIHKKGVFAFHQLNDKQLLSLGGEGGLTLWDIPNARSIETLELSAESLRCIDKHPFKSEIAIGSSGGNIYLVHSETLELKKVLKQAHQNSVFSVRYSPDGQYLLSGGRDAYLRIRETVAYEELPTQAAHLFTVNDIAFHPTLPYFATASRDKTIKIWDAQSFALLKVIDSIRYGGHLKSVNGLLWSKYNNELISCSDDRSIIIWELAF